MSKIVWMDLEMTGLDVEKDRIMEIVCVISDSTLSQITEGPRIVLHQSDETLNNMGDWCKNTHIKTGLWDECRQSTVTDEQAEAQVLTFLQQNDIKSRECPLAGNTIYMDRIFLYKYMPKLNEFLHYRLIDVSTCKELCSRWNADLYAAATVKRNVHRGYEDIMESINELKYYKQFMFQQQQSNSSKEN